MLQRAANNVNTSWWASNIRTKQSKWLDSDVQEMETRVKSMLKIVEGDGDSFSKKAEMYFKKRPELIQFVEETYKSYKALADKYDHLSAELHKANHTIAAACPEKLQIEKDDEDDSHLPKAIDVVDSKSKENHAGLKKSRDSKVDSKRSKEKAEEEIDRLQKEIVVLETEKEYLKCSYESGIAKCLDIEKRIAEIQEEVFLLQNEFNANVEVSNDVAYNLMAATALKSCEDSVAKLQEQQEKVKEEIERIKNAKEKAAHNNEDKNLDKKKKNLENSSGNLALENITDKINELVTRVINLELTATSQASQIKSMRSDVDILGQSMNAGNSAAVGQNRMSEVSRKKHAKGPSLEDFILCEYQESEKNNLQADKQEANMIRSQTTNNTNEIDKKNQELAEMDRQITKLKNDILTKDKEIQSLKREISASQASNKMNAGENKNTELVEMARQITGLKNDNSTKDEEILNLKSLLPNDKNLESFDKGSSLEVLSEGSDKDKKSLNSDVEKYRRSIDKAQEENIEFWIKFCTSFQNKQKFQTIYNELLAEIRNPNPEYISIEKKLRDLKNELHEWLEENTVMQEELERKVSCMNTMQEEISKTTGENHVKLTLKGELLSMQTENSKAAQKLQVGIDQIIGLHSEIDKTIQGIHEKFEDNQKKFQRSCTKKNIPLGTFLNMDSTKKKQSIFARLKSKKNKLGRVNSMPTHQL